MAKIKTHILYTLYKRANLICKKALIRNQRFLSFILSKQFF